MMRESHIPKNDAIITHTLSTSDTLVVVVPIACREKFNELIHRGANLWPDAPPYIKELADNVTNGFPLQNYRDHSSTQLDT